MQTNQKRNPSVYRKGLKPRAKKKAHAPAVSVGDALSFDSIADVSPHALFPDERDMVAEVIRSSDRPGMVEWAKDNVSFHKEYKACVFEGPWSPDLTPFWIEPMEAFVDRYTRSVRILKCSQCGATENLALMFMRYSAKVLRQSCMLVMAQETMGKTFFKDRVHGGIKHCVKGGEEIVDDAEINWTHCIMSWRDFQFRVAWAKSKAAQKGDPWRIMLLDEVSTYPAGTLEKLLKRMETWQGLGKALIMSAMDVDGRHHGRDPMLIEHEKSDQRVYELPDKRKGSRYPFVFGYDFEKKVQLPYGVKWSPKAKRSDGSWDLDAVEESAHYLTPEGRKITSEQRNKMLRNHDGVWRATNPQHSDRDKGYLVNSMMLPWCSFGSIARRFVKATSPSLNKPKLRIFVLEDLAEDWIDQKSLIRDDELKARRAAYDQREIFSEVEPYKTFYIGAQRKIFLSCDVQQKRFEYVVREWLKGDFEGHKVATGLIDEGEAVAWEDLDYLMEEYRADFCLMDNNYDKRITEVQQNCAARVGFVTTVGRDARMRVSYQHMKIDPYEGTRKAGGAVTVDLFQYDSDVFRSDLMEMVRGEKDGVEWYVPREYRQDYWRQLLSTEKRDGVWQTREGFGKDHKFDCETLQVLAATLSGLREWN